MGVPLRSTAHLHSAFSARGSVKGRIKITIPYAIIK